MSIDMESFRIQQTTRGRVALERQLRSLKPAGSKPGRGAAAEELEPLSRIIEALNERFGLNLGRERGDGVTTTRRRVGIGGSPATGRRLSAVVSSRALAHSAWYAHPQVRLCRSQRPGTAPPGAPWRTSSARIG